MEKKLVERTTVMIELEPGKLTSAFYARHLEKGKMNYHIFYACINNIPSVIKVNPEEISPLMLG